MVLVGFVLLATGVIWRRSIGTARAREQQLLELQRDALEAERAKLKRDVRDASSRARLARVAEERLNMHVPNDSQVIFLKRVPRAKSPKGSQR
jgi:cell division protein FtsL